MTDNDGKEEVSYIEICKSKDIDETWFEVVFEITAQLITPLVASKGIVKFFNTTVRVSGGGIELLIEAAERKERELREQQAYDAAIGIQSSAEEGDDNTTME